jgi:hypothetical protein
MRLTRTLQRANAKLGYGLAARPRSAVTSKARRALASYDLLIAKHKKRPVNTGRSCVIFMQPNNISAF